MLAPRHRSQRTARMTYCEPASGRAPWPDQANCNCCLRLARSNTFSERNTAVTCPSKPSKHTTPTFLKWNFMRCRPLATPRALIATVLSRTRPSRQRQRPRIWESDGRKGERKREACKWTTEKGSAANGFFTAEHLRIPYPQQCRYSEHSRTAGQSETCPTKRKRKSDRSVAIPNTPLQPPQSGISEKWNLRGNSMRCLHFSPFSSVPTPPAPAPPDPVFLCTVAGRDA